MGVFWTIFLSRIDSSVTTRLIPLALVGSLLPDVEHIYYHMILNRKKPYAREIKLLLKNREVRNLVKFLESNHKTVSYLPFHHVFVALIALLATLNAFIYGREGTMVFLGAISLHYFFDIGDDVITLGKLNPNWTRGWRRLRRVTVRSLGRIFLFNRI